ncbi:hypothetical protein ACSBR2_014316 [Camellia fascicularis]
MGNVYCSDCKRASSTSPILCIKSHLRSVQEHQHSIDETSKWRTFANDGGGVRSFCRRHSVLGVQSDVGITLDR